MTAEEAKRIADNIDGKSLIAGPLALIEEEARQGNYYVDIQALNVRQVAALQSLGFKLEVFGNRARVRWE